MRGEGSHYDELLRGSGIIGWGAMFRAVTSEWAGGRILNSLFQHTTRRGHTRGGWWLFSDYNYIVRVDIRGKTKALTCCFGGRLFRCFTGSGFDFHAFLVFSFAGAETPCDDCLTNSFFAFAGAAGN